MKSEFCPFIDSAHGGHGVLRELRSSSGWIQTLTVGFFTSQARQFCSQPQLFMLTGSLGF